MRNLFVCIPLIFLILVGTVACTSQSPVYNKSGNAEFYEFNTNRELTLDDFNEFFSHENFSLKPQMEGDYPKLNGVESKAYELIDGMVYIHIFENNEELKVGRKQIKEVYEYEHWGLIGYEVNNMLFVYIPAHATEELVINKNKEMINAIKGMISS